MYILITLLHQKVIKIMGLFQHTSMLKSNAKLQLDYLKTSHLHFSLPANFFSSQCSLKKKFHTSNVNFIKKGLVLSL